MAVCKCFKKTLVNFLTVLRNTRCILVTAVCHQKKNYISKLKWEMVFDRMHFSESLIDFLSFDL